MCKLARISILLLTMVAVPVIPSWADPVTLERDLGDIRADGTLRAAVVLMEPWTMRGNQQEYVGFLADLARQLAADTGLEIQFVELTIDNFVEALNSGKVDVVPSFIHPTRALQVYLSRPYADAGISIAANIERTEGITSLQEMNNHDVTIAVLEDTLAQSITAQMLPNATMLSLSSPDALEQAVLKGDAHAFVSASPLPELATARHPDQLFLPLDEPFMETAEAFAIRRGHVDLLNYLNAWIEFRSKDHWIEESRRYWFETTLWQDQVASED